MKTITPTCLELHRQDLVKTHLVDDTYPCTTGTASDSTVRDIRLVASWKAIFCPQAIRSRSIIVDITGSRPTPASYGDMDGVRSY